MAVQAYIDGADVSDCVQAGSFTRRLNRPASATLRMFSDCAPPAPTYRIKIVIDGTLWFHGMISQISTEAAEDGNLMTEYTAFDPMWMWMWRPARSGPASADPGDFSNPDLFTAPTTNPADKGMAAVIMEQILLQSEVDDDAEGEGPLFLEIGDFTAFNPLLDLSGAPTDYPMTIAEVFELMASTGTFDCVITPTDALPNMGRVDAYLGDYGTDHSDGPDGDGTCIFEYATGAHNVRSLRMNEDSSNIVNKLWYYLGPRVETALDPGGDQHWRANVTGSPDGVNINPLNHPPYAATQAQIITRRDASRDNWGVRMEVRIYDAQGDENPAQFRHLYYRLWQEESWLRAIPRTLVHITPIRLSEAMLLPPGVSPVQLGDFDIGDLVTVTAGPVVRGGFTGVQRIYSFTVDWDEDGVLELGELQVSSDAEGI